MVNKLIKSPYAKTIIIHGHVLDHDLPLKYSEERDHEQNEDLNAYTSKHCVT
jgi:hypothetical protein